MRSSPFWLFVTLLFFAVPVAGQPAQPTILSPTVEPATPIANQSFSIRVRAGDCVGFYDFPTEAELVANGAQLDLLIDGSIAPGEPFCVFPLFNYAYHVAGLPAGSYTLRIVVLNAGPPPEIVPYDNAVVSFTVAPAPALPVPAGNAAGAAALVVVIVLAASFVVRRRRRALAAVSTSSPMF
jgi:uncharacterized protein (TIGR03382 family)